MAAETPRTERGNTLYRIILTILLVGIIIALFQVVFTLLTYSSEARAFSANSENYAQTGTALAIPPAGTPVAYSAPNGQAHVRAKSLAYPSFQDFPTNTPVAEVTIAVTPTPDPGININATPHPLPTLMIYSTSPDEGDVAPTAIPTAVPQLDRQGYDLINVVLLGNDNELTGESVARTDTMIIVSINRTTGTVSLLSLPRDLYVYIPSWTMQRINTAYPYGESVGWTDGGFGLLRQTIFYNLGINVHYYAMVDLSGFVALVDAVGGVDVAVDCGIQDLPLIGAEVPSAAYPVGEDGEYVLPVGYYHLDGSEALWYARSRTSSSDFDRGVRQQQILRAVWRAARDNGLLAQAPTLYSEGIQYVETNMAFENILSLVPIAANLDPAMIENFSLTRTYHTTPWQTPDGDYVQLPVYETMRPLLEDFYAPPTENQLAIEGATVGIYNGTNNPNLDIVAAERLQADGFNAVALGAAPTTEVADTQMTDYTGRSKGSSLEQIALSLNINPNNIQIEPSGEREYDFVVTLGSSYDSCTRSGVLPVATPAP
jgi:LCP family protein required for cell wall assembly